MFCRPPPVKGLSFVCLLRAAGSIRPALRPPRTSALGCSPEDLRHIERGAEARRASSRLRKRPVDLGACCSLDRDRMRGVQYHPGHAWRILRQMGWNCQRPTGRARERDEPGIQCWKQKRWPEIKKSPSRAAHDRLRRGKRTEPEAAPLSHMGAEGADARVAIFISTGRRCRQWRA